ncbi:MAG: hypothetical protein ABIO72_01050 [Patescibacteria group bacterium]
MSWLEPPPLVEKPLRPRNLPQTANPQRIREFAVKGAMVGSVVGLLFAALLIAIFRSMLMPHWILVTIISTGLCTALATWMMSRAIRFALMYGMSQKPPTPKV